MAKTKMTEARALYVCADALSKLDDNERLRVSSALREFLGEFSSTNALVAMSAEVRRAELEIARLNRERERLVREQKALEPPAPALGLSGATLGDAMGGEK